MSVALIATAAPVVIDLTSDSPTRTTYPTTTSPYKHANPNQSFLISSDEPPAKKRRVDYAGPPAWSLTTCIKEHLLPHVDRAVKELELCQAEYQVDELAVRAVTSLLRSTRLPEKLELGNGLLSSDDNADISNQALRVVTKLSALSEYQVPKLQSTKAEPTSSNPTPRPEPKVIQLLEPAQTKPKPYTGPTRVPRPRVLSRRVCPKPKNNLPAGHTWLQLQRRPYLHHTARQDISRGVDYPVVLPHDKVQLPAVYHVDFTSLEVAEIAKIVEQDISQPVPRTREGLGHVSKHYDVLSIIGDAISGRTRQDIYNFCYDLNANNARQANEGQILSLEKASPQKRARNRRANRVPALLLAREIEGNVGFGRMRRYENFQNAFQICHEDGLGLIAEFTNCAGDISAMSWVPDGNVICGTTAHSDAHNQQYNKPGNLLLCSTTHGTLRAFPDHRIQRPVVAKGENSTEAMRQSQDPWLYSSVVSTDYDEVNGRAFTSSFDKTVKVWNVSKDGISMEAMATWHHQGNVNFVVAAKDGSGRVATAADVPTHAIRVYTVDPNNMQESPYHTISCTRNDADGSDKWAYFPATMRWGPTPSTQHLLAIGYSPRSFTSDDSDIPEDKLHSGEIVLWDAEQKCQVPVLTATTANVFEIVWHPALPSFVVATSPSGLNIEHGVRTHIHLFQLDRGRGDGAYSEFQKLDCYASDINELTIMPNSLRHAYITAACTDGRVYVWDTAQGDRPIHKLGHGYPLDAFLSDREKDDTGVKFTAWGTTLDRFYTGSSDGVVKVWNVRRKRSPFVRKLLEAPGPISCGVFSPDHSKLVIGDATGRVFLFSVDDRDEIESHFITIPGTDRRIRRPTPLIPHAEPEPPTDSSQPAPTSIAQQSQEQYLASNQLIIHPNPVIGAVQGPAYPSTGLFRLDAHAYSDPLAPLLPELERNQRSTIHASLGPRSRSIRRLKDTADCYDTLERKRHEKNLAADLDVSSLENNVIEDLVRCGAMLSLDGEEGWDFKFEDSPGEV